MNGAARRIIVLMFAVIALALSAQETSERARSSPPAGARVPYIDVHVHLDPADIAGSIAAALRAMPGENAAMILFLPPPFTPDSPARYDAEQLLPAIKAHPKHLAALGGGGSLNAKIQSSVQSGDAGPEVQKKFRQRAEELVRAGVVGFGEMTAEHFQGATPYQHAAPDHPLFLLLADIAAEHDLPIDLHFEPVPQTMPLPAGLKGPPQLEANVAGFERLLAHNPRAKIVWAHAGWDLMGTRTPELCRRLLRAHPNLYMEIKIDPEKAGKNSPLTEGGAGTLKPEWLKLFQDFSDRFVIGTDQHYPEPNSAEQRWQAVVRLLNQLPPDLRKKIGRENAVRIYRLSEF